MLSLSQRLARQPRRAAIPREYRTSSLLRSRLTHIPAQTFTSQTRPRTQQPERRTLDNADDVYDPEEPELKLEDFGEYDIILPESDDASHAPTRTVPCHILRPPYAATGPRMLRHRVEAMLSGAPGSMVRLGGEEEHKLRQAARLAQRTLAMAGSLVAVRIAIFTMTRDVEQPCSQASRRTRSTREYTSSSSPMTRIRRRCCTRAFQSLAARA